MSWFRKNKQTEDDLHRQWLEQELRELKEKINKMIAQISVCAECGYYFQNYENCNIKVNVTKIKSYCRTHRPSYDEIYTGCDDTIIYFKRLPAQKIEVDKKGNPIKEKKKK